MPRAFSSGAASIWSYALNSPPKRSAPILVSAAVSVVLPWSTWPIVPTLTCGLVRWNFSLDIVGSFLSVLLDDGVGDVARRLGVMVEFHREGRAALRHGAHRGRVAEHLAQRQHRVDDLAGRGFVGALQAAA